MLLLFFFLLFSGVRVCVCVCVCVCVGGVLCFQVFVFVVSFDVSFCFFNSAIEGN